MEIISWQEQLSLSQRSSELAELSHSLDSSEREDKALFTERLGNEIVSGIAVLKVSVRQNIIQRCRS